MFRVSAAGGERSGACNYCWHHTTAHRHAYAGMRMPIMRVELAAGVNIADSSPPFHGHVHGFRFSEARARHDARGLDTVIAGPRVSRSRRKSTILRDPGPGVANSRMVPSSMVHGRCRVVLLLGARLRLRASAFVAPRTCHVSGPLLR